MSNRILVATDGSENAARAVAYVGQILRTAHDCHITLVHVLDPPPPQLLEHGGSEDPGILRAKEERLQQRGEAWARSERQAEYPILDQARKALQRAGVPPDRIGAQLVHRAPHEGIDQRLLEVVKDGGYDTVVVGRRGTSMMEKLFYGSVTESLLKNAEGLTIWVVQ